MSDFRLLLCTDLDRTLIPNGHQPESPNARLRFSRFCQNPEVTLAYVTGRHQQLVQQAIEEYQLPQPDFVITDVGTKIYQVVDKDWIELRDWENLISTDWQGKSRQQLEVYLKDVDALERQEEAKQNTYKLSYYVSLDSDHHALMQQVDESLEAQGIAASLVWSVDEPAQVGLLDILPRSASKLHAIEFLQHHLGLSDKQLLFAGDSGNDLHVLSSHLQSVLVANASAEVRTQAQTLSSSQGNVEQLYLAGEKSKDDNGNYASGILQGVCHFMPEFCCLIESRKAK